MAAFRSTDLETTHGLTSPALANLIDGMHADRQKRIEGLTLADLIPQGPAGHPALPPDRVGLKRAAENLCGEPTRSGRVFPLTP